MLFSLSRRLVVVILIEYLWLLIVQKTNEIGLYLKPIAPQSNNYDYML